MMISIVGKPFLLLTFVILLSGNVFSVKEWRGIVPLKSTRADVERLLGRPDNESISTYYLPEATVSFQYSQRKCDEGWNVPPQTVIYIGVNLTKQKPLAELNLDLTKYKKEPGDYDVPDHFYYIDKEQGIAISVRGGMTYKYIYGPRAEDAPLRCPKTDK
jgi:hypothetical protein